MRVSSVARRRVLDACMDARGQVLPIAAICMTVLLSFLALSVDVGLMFYQSRSVQTAADSAAVAGAEEIRYRDVTSAAKADASINGFTDGIKGVSVTVNNPPQSGPNASNSNYVEVIITAKPTTFFMRLLGPGTMTVGARAVATMGGQTQTCFDELATTGTNFNLSNGAQVDVSGCALYGNSSSSNAMSDVGGAYLCSTSLNLSGSDVMNNGGSKCSSMTVNTGAPPLSDPLAYLTPPSAGTVNAANSYSYGTHTLTPGTYNGLSFGGGGTDTLSPGVYYIQNGVFSVNGGATLNGTGVTIYLDKTSSLSIGNGVNINLTAPTSGVWNGILFYQDRANATAESIEGGATLSLQGILYFPSASLTFENGTSTNVYATIISQTVTFAGGTKVQNYALVNSSTPISAARVVE